MFTKSTVRVPYERDATNTGLAGELSMTIGRRRSEQRRATTLNATSMGSSDNFASYSRFRDEAETPASYPGPRPGPTDPDGNTG
jgi:hypothetical protein